jgi:hypothetical protein
MGNGGLIPRLRRVPWDNQDVGSRRGNIRDEQVVLGVDFGLIPDEKIVTIDLRHKRLRGVAPDTVSSFGHGDGLGDTFET